MLLVNQRGAFAVVAHARHQILDPVPPPAAKVLPGLPEVMKVQAIGAGQAGTGTGTTVTTDSSP